MKKVYIYYKKTDFSYCLMYDDEDHALVSSYKWSLLKRKTPAVNYYVSGRKKGSRNKEYIHRVLMGAAKGQSVDHIDGNGLNNTRSNLRLATASQNNSNGRLRSDNVSGVKGLRSKKLKDGIGWQARVGKDGVVHCKNFKEKDVAIKWLMEKREACHGEFCNHGLRDAKLAIEQQRCH